MRLNYTRYHNGLLDCVTRVEVAVFRSHKLYTMMTGGINIIAGGKDTIGQLTDRQSKETRMGCHGMLYRAKN